MGNIQVCQYNYGQPSDNGINIGSGTGVADWRLSQVQSKSEILISWSITSYWNVWMTLITL